MTQTPTLRKKFKLPSFLNSRFFEKLWVQKFCKKEEPEVKFGDCLCFTQDVYHRRTILNKNKIRINLEFRIFPDYEQDLISL